MNSDKIERQKVYSKAIDQYGLEAQMNQLQEECAELIVAVNKYRRNGSVAEPDLLEELADVTIMVEQITLALNGQFQVDQYVSFKINRLSERIRIEKTE